MKEYTEAIHAKRLLKMLNKKDPCSCCPAGLSFSPGGFILGLSGSALNKEGVCAVCQNFVNLSTYGCPCYHLGTEAIKRTWLALEAKGYI